VCTLILLLCWWYSPANADLALLQIPDKAASAASTTENSELCQITLKLTETPSGQQQVIAGMLRIRDAQGNLIPLPELLNRGTGVNSRPESERAGIHSWSVIPGEVQLSVPRSRLTLEAFSGLSTELTRTEIDLAGKSSAEITLKL
jgi:hypothetical protein